MLMHRLKRHVKSLRNYRKVLEANKRWLRRPKKP